MSPSDLPDLPLLLEEVPPPDLLPVLLPLALPDFPDLPLPEGLAPSWPPSSCPPPGLSDSPLPLPELPDLPPPEGPSYFPALLSEEPSS